jgi:succinate dehydrogenase / fumarate reductase cytochrome b subunit
MATRERPLSPFMIGPYYRPQLTSVLSILHRGAGVVLAAGGLLVVAWLVALAFDAEAYARLGAALASLPGKLALMLLVAALVYHFFNGLRHLAWDAGHGYEIRKVYASGWAVVALTVVFTALIWWIGLGGRA